MKYYAGIGSRETPPDILNKMKVIAKVLAKFDFVLRSGCADGADTAFEQGCLEVQGMTDLWLPWPKFNGREYINVSYPNDNHIAIAATVHPAWEFLKESHKKLHARNVGQILGDDLNTPVSFVICYTQDGAESEAQTSGKTGGTGTAIRLASRHGIPIFNMKNPNFKKRFTDFIRTMEDL